jgi:3',5'-cyclic AMP phosphodiesterase CpdA
LRSSCSIVHFSDLHLTPDDSKPRSEPKLYGRLKGMNEAFRHILRSEVVRRCDLILVTGDVTDDGSRKAWLVFWSALGSLAPKKRCLVVPGNHDVCNLRFRWPESKTEMIKHDLARVRLGLRMGGQRVHFPWAHPVDDRTVIFGLDSCNKGNLSAVTNAIGPLGFYQLEKFARLLYAHRDFPIKIVALHHSPNIPRNETLEKRGLLKMSRLERWGFEMPEEDRRTLRLLCLSHRVRLIVHGHLHRAEDRRVNGVRIIGSPATTQPAGAMSSRYYQFYMYWCWKDGRDDRLHCRLCRVAARENEAVKKIG